MTSSGVRLNVGPRVCVDPLVDIRHLLQVLLGALQLAAALRVRGLPKMLDDTLEGLVILVPRHVVLVHLVHGARVRHWHGLGRLAAASARGLALPAALGLRLLGLALGRPVAVIVVHAPHVVLEVPGPGEALAFLRALAPLVSAVIGLVSVHAVGFALVAEQAGSGGEAGIGAGLDLAAVGPEVRVDKLATEGRKALVSAACLMDSVPAIGEDLAAIAREDIDLLVVALQLLGLVVAIRSSFPRAMEKTVCLGGGVLVEVVIPRSLAIQPRPPGRLVHGVRVLAGHGDSRQVTTGESWHSHILAHVRLRHPIVRRRRVRASRSGAERRLVPRLICLRRRLRWRESGSPGGLRGRRSSQAGVRVELHVSWVHMHVEVGERHGHVQAQRRLLVVHLRVQRVRMIRVLVKGLASAEELGTSGMESKSITCQAHVRHAGRHLGWRNSCLRLGGRGLGNPPLRGHPWAAT